MISALLLIINNVMVFLTFLGSKVLAGLFGDVTVKSRPLHRTVAGPGSCSCLRAGAAVQTAHLAAQVHIVLHTKK